ASTEPAAPLSKFWVPVRRQGCRLEKAADSFALLDAEEREIARINETAAQIWRLCDGRVSVGELIRILSAIHFAAPRAVREDVHQVLRALEGHGLMSFEKKPPRHAEPGPNAIRFYSFANRVGSPQLRLLKESAEHEGVSVEVLGDGLARFPTTVKLDLLYEQVRELDDDQIVCAVDGFDVFFCAGAEEIARKFRAMGCDCVFSAERAYSHQYPKYRKFYDELPVDSPYRYLNAGSIIGYAHALKKICAPTLSTRLQPLVINPRSINRIKRWSSRVAKTLRLERFDPGFIYSYVYYTDQQHYGKVVARGSSKLRIRLDHDTELFWCTAFEWRDIEAHYRTESGRIVNVHTGNVPAVIHVPGWRVHGHVFRRLAEVHSSLAGDR
ncbi:MAG: PqqD family peptide modification chaperone, partial [Acidobacteriota bacterium]